MYSYGVSARVPEISLPGAPPIFGLVPRRWLIRFPDDHPSSLSGGWLVGDYRRWGREEEKSG